MDAAVGDDCDGQAGVGGVVVGVDVVVGADGVVDGVVVNRVDAFPW